LKKLKRFDLSNNNLKYLPVEMYKMKLELLTVTGNPFMSESEVDMANKRISFLFPSLEIIAKEKIYTRKYLNGENVDTFRDARECSICNKNTLIYQKLYRLHEDNGVSIPYEYIACSVKCAEDARKGDLCRQFPLV
jgi:Leucine-rich repeat (LRR) protein